MTIEKGFFRLVMGHFATGVTVVTAQQNGVPAGLTVNSFCSVSLEPPLVLVCVDLNSQTLPYIRESGAFAINILNSEQERLSQCFAMPSEERYKHFCQASFKQAATNSPIINGSLGFIDTRVVAEYPGGDHIIFLGQVEALGVDGEAFFMDRRDASYLNDVTSAQHQNNGAAAAKERMPLLYYRGQYRHMAPHYQKPSLDLSDKEREATGNKPAPSAPHVE